MREYRQKTEQLRKLQLEGLEGVTDVNISKGFYEELVKLQTILKNNQVVLQYRGVFADLTKTLEEGTRALKENLAVEQSRMELTKEVTGYMKGFSEGIADINLGVQKYSELSDMQRAIRREPRIARTAEEYRLGNIRRTALQEQVYGADKALVALESISDVSKGFGAALSPEDMKRFTEVVAATQDKGAASIVVETSKVAENTLQTVDRLDKVLENLGDPTALEDMLSKFSDRTANVMATFGGPTATVTALERVARVRSRAESGGDQDIVISSNKALDILSKQLIQQVGYSNAMERVDDNITLLSKKFTPQEFQQRAFAGIDLEVLLNKLEKGAPDSSSQLKQLRKLQEEDGKRSIVSAKQ